jgi:hypothetical protein
MTTMDFFREPSEGKQEMNCSDQILKRSGLWSSEEVFKKTFHSQTYGTRTFPRTYRPDLCTTSDCGKLDAMGTI